MFSPELSAEKREREKLLHSAVPIEYRVVVGYYWDEAREGGRRTQ